MDAWNWITGGIKGKVSNGEWLHTDSLRAIADVFARTFGLARTWRFPLYITPATAREWSEIWKLIYECRAD